MAGNYKSGRILHAVCLHSENNTHNMHNIHVFTFGLLQLVTKHYKLKNNVCHHWHQTLCAHFDMPCTNKNALTWHECQWHLKVAMKEKMISFNNIYFSSSQSYCMAPDSMNILLNLIRRREKSYRFGKVLRWVIDFSVNYFFHFRLE